VAKPLPSHRIPYQFDAKRFRNAIQFVFEMGEPPDVAQQIMFHFTDVLTFAGNADGDLVPFNPAETPTRVTKAPLNVPCDVEFVGAGDQETAFGAVIPAKLKVLLLDVDYAKVKDASFVVMNGDRYLRDYEQPSFGLFDVGLHTMVFKAENEI
jgi:hypothetical protein